MNLTSRSALAAVAALGVSAIVATAATPAEAAVPQPSSYSSVESCTGLTGSISYTPGLTGVLRERSAVFTGTLTGCSGYSGAQDGTGTVTAVLSGASTASSVTETGQVTVNWPASSGLNPSNGTITLRETTKGGLISVSGSVASGAFTGARLSTTLLPYAHHGAGTKAHPLTRQSVTNTAPFAAMVNFG